MKRYTNEERENHVAAWKTSGLARSAYAREQGIHPTTFCKWVKERGQKEQGFVELPGAALYQGNGEIIIDKGDARIRLPAEMLGTVLKTVFDNCGGLS